MILDSITFIASLFAVLHFVYSYLLKQIFSFISLFPVMSFQLIHPLYELPVYFPNKEI